jgi:hypothetical protein
VVVAVAVAVQQAKALTVNLVELVVAVRVKAQVRRVMVVLEQRTLAVAAAVGRTVLLAVLAVRVSSFSVT